MSDNETDLLKWTAFASTSDREAVGYMLNELAKEIARLRSVCRVASDCVGHAMGHITPSTHQWKLLDLVVRDLTAAGTEATE